MPKQDNQFHESDLRITFSEKWKVIAFDKHRYYQSVNGRGFLGVDFIGVHPEYGVFLMEIKNYRLRFGDELHDQVKAYIDDPTLLASVLIPKFEDSIRLLDVVYIYLSRKWWFKMAVTYSLFYRYF